MGGGITGLACAKALLNRGAGVTVYEESGSPGQGALWASGGMLAGGFESAEADVSQVFAALARRGMALWAEWAEDMGQARIGYRVAGIVSPESDAAGRGWLEGMAARAEKLDIPYRYMTQLPEGIRARSAIVFPEDGELDNRLLGPRLVAFIRAAGGQILERMRVTEVSPQRDGIRIESLAGRRIFDAVILATGIAGGNLLSAEPVLNAVHPVKGQMLSLEGRERSLTFCLRAKNAYVSQKPDGRFVVGATSEPGKRDAHVDEAAISVLRQNAESWLPALEGMRITECWSGIRPGTQDDRPILGPGTLPGVFLALGLYRNGVLLAPAVGELIANTILSGAAIPQEFQAARFSQR